MKEIDKKAELIKVLQTELDIRTQVEEEAVRLIESCKFEKAQEILKSLDNNIVEDIRRELERLDADNKKPAIMKKQDAVAEVCGCVGKVIGDFLVEMTNDILVETITVNKERLVQVCEAYSEGLSVVKSEK